MYRELLDLQHLCVFLEFPGLSRAAIDEQLELVAGEVMPRLGVTLEPRPLPGRVAVRVVVSVVVSVVVTGGA